MFEGCIQAFILKSWGQLRDICKESQSPEAESFRVRFRSVTTCANHLGPKDKSVNFAVDIRLRDLI